jgi:hypothetical protein
MSLADAETWWRWHLAIESKRRLRYFLETRAPARVVEDERRLLQSHVKQLAGARLTVRT